VSTIDIATVRQLREKLREHFGFRRFRPGQAEAMSAIVEGRDTLVIMPTGSGKSLCYQLPGLVLEGKTVVVSPLIALMKDQADNLRQHHLEVAEVNSTLTAAEERETVRDIATGKAEFVYATPERMADPDFRALLRQQPIGLFVVDEAHCVSQWGHDFRPDYLTLGSAIEELGSPPVLALTATATADVIDDILTQLRIPDAEIVHTGFHRPNLRLSVEQVSGEEAKRGALLGLLRREEGTGIIYVATVRAVEELTQFLAGWGIEAEGYHGRLSAKRRTEAQDRFMEGRVKVMVATNAFGLGIDKPDVRYVIHYHLPGTLEAFYQEFGRAGRDGLTAHCTLLYDPEDRKLQKFFQSRRYPDDTDLVNAHHALKRLSEGPKPPTFDEVLAIAPLPKTRLKVCLDLLVNRDVVKLERGRRYRLLRPDMDRDQLARVGQSYRERHERDELKQKQMTDYAEQHTCRWHTLLDYFGGEGFESGRCKHCDRCVPEVVPASDVEIAVA